MVDDKKTKKRLFERIRFYIADGNEKVCGFTRRIYGVKSKIFSGLKRGSMLMLTDGTFLFYYIERDRHESYFRLTEALSVATSRS
jgi:hypothetical protein